MEDSTNIIDLKQMHSCYSGLDGCSKRRRSISGVMFLKIFLLPSDTNTCFFSNLKSRAFKGLQMITSHFWNSVLKTWLDLNYHDPSMPVPTVLWSNSHIKYQGNVLVFTD